jgi:hypothetical protein
LCLLSSLILSFLLDVLVLIDGLLISILLGSLGSLSLFDFSDCFLSKGLLVFGTSCFYLFYVFKGHSLDGSLLSEQLLLLVLALVRLLQLLVKSPPGSSPSESLGLELPE